MSRFEEILALADRMLFVDGVSRAAR